MLWSKSNGTLISCPGLPSADLEGLDLPTDVSIAQSALHCVPESRRIRRDARSSSLVQRGFRRETNADAVDATVQHPSRTSNAREPDVILLNLWPEWV